MEKDYEAFILNRCENKLLDNGRFREIQKCMVEAYKKDDIDTYSELSTELQTLVIRETYKFATKDFFMLILMN